MVMSDKKDNNTGFRWIKKPEQKGEFLFTFDGKKVFNLFSDYPHELTAEQKMEFDEKNPFWADFFKEQD
mgnify:CR=1 FL=1